MPKVCFFVNSPMDDDAGCRADRARTEGLNCVTTRTFATAVRETPLESQYRLAAPADNAPNRTPCVVLLRFTPFAYTFLQSIFPVVIAFDA